MTLRSLCLLATLIPYVLADVKFTSPEAGASITGSTIAIEWEDSGTDPPITDLLSYQIFLCAGGNDADQIIQLATLVPTGSFKTGSSTSGSITFGLGADEQNAYFLKIISSAIGGSVINYSDRFSIPSMTGVFPPNVEAGVKSVTGTGGPPSSNNIAKAGGADPAGEGATVPYTMQTGLTRYAPMPSLPVSKITKKGPSPLYPTSSYIVATGPLPTPLAQMTITASQTFSASSIENTVAAAGQPSDAAMQKFLNRWKD